MADYMSGRIWIGGQISHRVANRLCEALARERVALDWGDYAFHPKAPQQLLDACREHEGVKLLHLCDDEARWGQFDELEEFLIRRRIPFRRESEGKYESDPERVEFRPGLGRIRMLAGHDGQPLVQLAVARAGEKAMRRAAELLKSGEAGRARRLLLRELRQCQQALPAPVAPLPPFEIG